MKKSFAKKLSLIFGACVMLSPIILTISFGLICGAINSLNGNSLKTQGLNPPHFNPVCSIKTAIKTVIKED